ncbi:hypothetical protein M4D56_18670 [Cytobacillus oceanisediminis]|uniref:hypothetical protein n=1 Tax=Cytobacillus oceanisediminis TaxID=665099 RepID=UPI0020401E93|nr:hypothetical protein [Cytobacillus oceanisediminis]MCM3531112.1 hypothetical protein [Cytobacillus oceanisediminis]
MYQQIAMYATVFFVFLLALAFAFVYGESKRSGEYSTIQEKGYKIRKFYFLGLIAIMGFCHCHDAWQAAVRQQSGRSGRLK